jgi:hypothetical protein
MPDDRDVFEGEFAALPGGQGGGQLVDQRPAGADPLRSPPMR